MTQEQYTAGQRKLQHLTRENAHKLKYCFGKERRKRK